MPESSAVNPEKNLHARVPSDLLAQLQRAVDVEQITLDELVRDAIESRLNRKEWQDLLLYGERHAKERNLTESDIEDAIAAVRSEQHRG